MCPRSRFGDERRVVVTGIGVVSTIGETAGEFFDALVNGRSGITRWKHMDERICSKIGGRCSAAQEPAARISIPKIGRRRIAVPQRELVMEILLGEFNDGVG